MNKYFIHIDTFTESTILGLRLQNRMLDEFQHCMIDQKDIGQLKKVHDHILSGYIAEGGRGRSEFRVDSLDGDLCRFSINKGIRITCTRIRNEYE